MRTNRGTPRSLRWLGAGLCLALAATGCVARGSGAGSLFPRSVRVHLTPRPRLRITPGDGGKAVRPGKGITVVAGGGTLTSVHVKTSGTPVVGGFRQGRTAWQSRWALDVD